MHNLLISLKESDKFILPEIARFWQIDLTAVESSQQPKVMAEAMLQPEHAQTVWDRLNDAQRGVLQMLLGGMDSGRMLLRQFERMHGEIRKMGPKKIAEEHPLENPVSIAEALFYRGLIYEGRDQTPAGIETFIYIPPDLAVVLPNHQTTYDNLDADLSHVSPEDVQISALESEFVENVQAADTTIVDDMATLLAYLQVYSADVIDDGLAQEDIDLLRPHLIRRDAGRLAFLFEIGLSAGLIEVNNRLAHPRRVETRRWLEAPRFVQLKALADAWRTSDFYRDLWHVPGLYPEPAGQPYNPALARQAVLNFLAEHVPQHAWWSLDEFILTIKDLNPDFQRPNADYDNWYIRNDAGEYLRGFESWDAVEGALLEFYLYGPLHWLGMVDVAEDAIRLTGYGRPFVSGAAWPSQSDGDDTIAVKEDGTLEVSRRVSRFDRFQAMRFTDWVSVSTDGYILKLNADGIRRAAEQGINTGHIAAFITRMREDDDLPPMIATLLETWETGAVTGVTIDPMTVLRTTDPATLDYMMDTPGIRRYLGARLGPMAVAVRAGQTQPLRDALGEKGIAVEGDDDEDV